MLKYYFKWDRIKWFDYKQEYSSSEVKIQKYVIHTEVEKKYFTTKFSKLLVELWSFRNKTKGTIILFNIFDLKITKLTSNHMSYHPSNMHSNTFSPDIKVPKVIKFPIQLFS